MVGTLPRVSVAKYLPIWLQDLQPRRSATNPTSGSRMISLNTANIVFAMTITTIAVEAQNGEAKMKCLDTPRHKATPGPENLAKCEMYKNSSCCSSETSSRVHGDDLYFFNKALCNKQHELSVECRKFFLKDACFYECSPHIATWATTIEGTETVRNIPLCKSDCDDWFAACSNDFTCTKDWKKAHDDRDFKCYENDKCQTVKDKFKSSDDFCRKVWGNSYDVVPDGSNCMRINLKSKADLDQNSVVAQEHGANSSPTLTYNIIIVSLPLLLAVPSIA